MSFRFRGQRRAAPPQSRLRVKIPERSEDDFCPYRQAPALTVEKGAARTSPPYRMTAGYLVPRAAFLSGKASVTLKSLSNTSMASKALSFFPLNPFISFVLPDDSSYPTSPSVSSLFRKRRKMISPHEGLSHLATRGRITTPPLPHFGHGRECTGLTGTVIASISSVARRV